MKKEHYKYLKKYVKDEDLRNQMNFFKFKLFKAKDNDCYRLRVYDRDSHDNIDGGKGRWIMDIDLMLAVAGSHRSSVKNYFSIEMAIKDLAEYFKRRFYKENKSVDLKIPINYEWEEF
jgi:hypothetical protein